MIRANEAHRFDPYPGGRHCRFCGRTARAFVHAPAPATDDTEGSGRG